MKIRQADGGQSQAGLNLNLGEITTHIYSWPANVCPHFTASQWFWEIYIKKLGFTSLPARQSLEKPLNLQIDKAMSTAMISVSEQKLQMYSKAN